MPKYIPKPRIDDSKFLDLGTHLVDPTTGKNYARSLQPSHPPKKKKFRSKAAWDLVLPMWCLFRAGRMTVAEISKATGIKENSIRSHADRFQWDNVANKVNSMAAKSIVPTVPALAAVLQEGAEEFQRDKTNLVQTAMKYFKRQPGAKLIRRSKEVKDFCEIGDKTFRLNEEEKTAGPVFNVALLHQNIADIRIVRQ